MAVMSVQSHVGTFPLRVCIHSLGLGLHARLDRASSKMHVATILIPIQASVTSTAWPLTLLSASFH